MATPQSNLQLASDLTMVITRLSKKLRSQPGAVSNLSLTERAVIGQLYRQKQMLPSELAAAEKITTQSMSQVLNHLLELGLITRTASKEDKRKVNISLSANGERLVLKVRSERDEWLHKALSVNCNEKDITALRNAIGALTKLVDFE